MGNNKKDQAKHIPTKEVNNVENKKQRCQPRGTAEDTGR